MNEEQIPGSACLDFVELLEAAYIRGVDTIKQISWDD